MSENLNKEELDNLKALFAKGGKYDLSTELGRQAFAIKVLERVQTKVPAVDIVPMILDLDNSFKVGDTPEWWDLEGVTVYKHEPGAYGPRSKVSKETYTASPDFYSATVALNLVDLESGRYGSLAGIQDKMVDRLVGKKSAVLWDLLKSTITSSHAMYTSVATNLSDTALNLALKKVDDASGEAKAIIGRKLALHAIFDFDGTVGNDWSPEARRSVESTGRLGSYRGVPIIALPDFVDEKGVKLIDSQNVFVVGKNLGKYAPTIAMGMRQWEDPDTLEWCIKLFEEYMMALILTSRSVFRVEIT